MNRRDFLKTMAGLGAAAMGMPRWTGQARGAATAQPAGKPNFVILFTDDQGYGDVGCFGSETIRTPRLDRLAKEGLRLTSFYSQPVCGPARCALMTGCYPPRVARQTGGWSLSTDEVTVAEVLKQAAYATCCIGKWDLSRRRYVQDCVPNAQGFDHYFGTLGANDGGKVKLWRNREALRETSDMGELTGLYTDEAIAFIRARRGSPFLLYLAYTMPHVKIDASEGFRGKSKGGIYGDVIEEIDHNVGRLIDTLKELAIHEKTIVLFTSDNGPWLSKGPRGGSAKPLRDGKGSSWEGGFRVPAIVWGPGRVPAGRESNAMMATLDVLPTLAALAGAKAPSDRIIDGVDQSALITGKADAGARETFLYHVRGDLHAVRKGKWKLALPDRRRSYGYVVDKKPVTRPELYDLEADVSETRDVAEAHPDVVADLLKLAAHARADIGDVDKPGAGARNVKPSNPRKPAAKKKGR